MRDLTCLPKAFRANSGPLMASKVGLRDQVRIAKIPESIDRIEPWIRLMLEVLYKTSS